MNVRPLYNYVLVLTIVLSGASSAHAVGTLCEDLFTARAALGEAKSKSAFENELFRDLRNHETYAAKMNRATPGGSVARGQMTRGPFGGGQFLAERKAKLPWPNSYSRLKYGKKSVDAQGDVRSPIAVLGFELADVLGVHFVDENHLRLDDPDELSASIENFNAFLLRRNVVPIDVRFYVVPNHINGAFQLLEFYLQQMAESGSLPVKSPAEDWIHFLHDVSFHRHFAAVHPDLLKKFKTVARAKYEFWKFASDYFDENLMPVDAKIAKRALIFKLSDELDFANALLLQGNLYMLEAPNMIGQVRNVEREASAYASQLLESFGFPASPVDQLKNTVADLENAVTDGADATDYAYLFGPSPLPSAFPAGVWKKALNSFVRSNRDRDLKKNLFASEQELISLVLKQVERRKELMNAAKAYSRN